MPGHVRGREQYCWAVLDGTVHDEPVRRCHIVAGSYYDLLHGRSDKPLREVEKCCPEVFVTKGGSEISSDDGRFTSRETSRGLLTAQSRGTAV